MEIWLDTIDINIINKMNNIIPITGVTTNPAILSISKEHGFKLQMDKLLNNQCGLLAIQVLAENSDNMVNEALAIINSFGSRIVIKIPSTYEGFKAIKILKTQQIKTLATAVYEEKQALIAGLLNTNYIAPYFSRINSISNNGISKINSMLSILKINNLNSKLMVASIKTVEQLIEISKLGVHAITIPEDVILELIKENKNTNSDTLDFNKQFQENNIINNDYNTICNFL